MFSSTHMFIWYKILRMQHTVYIHVHSSVVCLAILLLSHGMPQQTRHTVYTNR